MRGLFRTRPFGGRTIGELAFAYGLLGMAVAGAGLVAFGVWRLWLVD